MALPLAKRYARFYMDTGKTKVSKAKGEDASGFVATMSEPMKVKATGTTEHLAKRALAQAVADAVFALLEQRKPAPVPLPKNKTGDKGGYAY